MPNTMPGNMLGLQNALVVVLSALGFAMAVWVYRANPRERENQGFSLMVLFIVSWVLCYHVAQLRDPTFWFRLSACAVFMFFVTYYFFIVEWFLGKRGRSYRLFGVAILLYGAILALLSVGTDIIISGSAVAGSVIRPVFGPVGRWTFYGFVIVLTLLINWRLMREYVGFPRERRAKLQYFLIGLLLFAGLNMVFNVVLPLAFGDYAYYALGNYSVGFLLGFTAFAIVKRELFGVRSVLATIFVATVGVLQAIDQAKRTDIQYVIAGAGSKDMVKKVMDGDKLIPVDVLYPPAMVGTAMELTAANFYDQVPVRGNYILDATLVTKDNAKDFYFPDSPF